MAKSCNPSNWKPVRRISKFKSSLAYLERSTLARYTGKPCFKIIVTIKKRFMSLSGHFILYNSSVKWVLLPRTSGSMGHRAVRQTRNQPPLLHSDFREDRRRGWGVIKCRRSAAASSKQANTAPSREHYLPAPPLKRHQAVSRLPGKTALSGRSLHPKPPHSKRCSRAQPMSHVLSQSAWEILTADHSSRVFLLLPA